MLPKSKRLNLKLDFKWVASGKRVETKYVKLFVKPGDNQTPRIGIAPSTKSFKKATQRNRAKRVVSAVFESLYSSLPSSINIVALPKAGILDVKSQDVLADLEEKLQDAKILH